MMDHTLHCGDCLEIMRSMPDASVDLVVTSPPYEAARREELCLTRSVEAAQHSPSPQSTDVGQSASTCGNRRLSCREDGCAKWVSMQIRRLTMTEPTEPTCGNCRWFVSGRDFVSQRFCGNHTAENWLNDVRETDTCDHHEPAETQQ